MIIDYDDGTVEIEVTDAMKEEVFQRVIGFFKEHESWSGESIMQCDNPQINAAPFLADLVDEVIKPKVKWR